MKFSKKDEGICGSSQSTNSFLLSIIFPDSTERKEGYKAFCEAKITFNKEGNTRSYVKKCGDLKEYLFFVLEHRDRSHPSLPSKKPFIKTEIRLYDHQLIGILDNHCYNPTYPFPSEHMSSGKNINILIKELLSVLSFYDVPPPSQQGTMGYPIITQKGNFVLVIRNYDNQYSIPSVYPLNNVSHRPIVYQEII